MLQRLHGQSSLKIWDGMMKHDHFLDEVKPPNPIIAATSGSISVSSSATSFWTQKISGNMTVKHTLLTRIKYNMFLNYIALAWEINI